MRKSIFYIMIIICLFSIMACGCQKGASEDIRDMIVDRTFIYEKDGIGGDFTISVNSDGTFQYYEGGFSSYIGMGSWTLEDDILILSDNIETGYPFVNRFKVDGNKLIFLIEDSSNFIYIKVADGECFTSISD